jgi:nitroimidazol reductase NimA-like FMN-containing flavoprotein (pyridoxamine 5'-phosphate oxidase superfamily)
MSREQDYGSIPPNVIRRDDRACDDGWIRDFLARATVGYVATQWDEQPFITPMNFWYDPAGHRIVFHSNIIGRMRANIERHPRACFSASEFGRMLPSNAALEFSIQYESAVVFGTIHIIEAPAAQEAALYGLIDRYFPEMKVGEEYRPIQVEELERTSAFELRIESWSGKRKWPDRADQVEDWPALGEQWFK